MLPRARREKLAVREMPEETLVYDLERSKCHCLNRTSALVWKHCDGQTTPAELARILQEELHVPEPGAVVELALEQLSRRHLLEEPVAPRSPAELRSRRDALKKIAVALVAVPAVMTITAKRARAAATPVRRSRSRPSECSGPCTTNEDCQQLGNDCFCFTTEEGSRCRID